MKTVLLSERTEPRRCTGGGCWGFSSWVSWEDGIGVGGRMDGYGLWEIGIEIEIETASTRRFQKPNNVRQQSLDTVVLVAGSCWLLTSSRWWAGWGWLLLLLLMSAGESEGRAWDFVVLVVVGSTAGRGALER